MPILSFFAGAGVILITAFDVFQSVVVPRPTGRRFRGSSFISQYSWLGWTRLAYRITNDDTREDFLGAFAPLLLISLLVFWVVSLIAGYGLIFFGLRHEIRPEPGFLESFYFAGTTLVTIGFGDYAPTQGTARFLSVAAGASGLGAFAIITAFLFPIVGAYQQREAFVVMFTNRAGSPPSGVDMIETHFKLGIIDSLVSTMRGSELWMAQVLETHLAYPILTYFRSTHDDISWVAVLGTILDASTLVITTLDTEQVGEAKIVNRLGRHLVNDFSKRFGLPHGDHVGIERHEFEMAYDRLRDVGIPLRDRDRAWKEFGEIRATYANQLNRMAKYWAIPPAQWFGDRSLIPHHGLLEVAGARER
jgi:hypothetical protein